MFMMDKEWSEANNTITVAGLQGQEGQLRGPQRQRHRPYALVSREQDVKTVLKRNDAYWGKGELPLGITEHHLSHDQGRRHARRGAALGRGRLRAGRARAGHRPAGEDRRTSRSTWARRTAPSSSAWMSASPELQTSNVKGKNPFADKRVRQAINMAIDREAIKRAVMRGQSVPAGIIAPPFVNGYTKELDALPKVDLAKAKALLKEAGYADGFQVTLHCPNDRYINDEGICQAATGHAGQDRHQGEPGGAVARRRTSPLIQKRRRRPSSTCWAGACRPTTRTTSSRSSITPASGSDGSWNATRYSNPDDRQADPEPDQRDRYGQAQRDDRRDLEDAERRDDLHRAASPDAGLRDEERPRHSGVAGQLRST